MKAGSMLIVALPGGAILAAALVGELCCEWTQLGRHTFPDGETLVRIDAEVAGRCVVFAGSLNQPDAKTLPLLFAADAARELGASQVGLVAPYLAYMRLVQAPWTVMAKTRTGDRDVSVELQDKATWPGHTPVLIDDIVSTGQTLIAAANVLQNAGLGPPVCALAQSYADGAEEAGHEVRWTRVADLDFPLLRSQARWEHGGRRHEMLEETTYPWNSRRVNASNLP